LLHRLADQLQLTPDQRKQIKTIVAADKSTLRPLVQEMRAARKDLRATIQTGNTSEAAVRAAAAKVAAIEADLAVERMKLFAQIAPILTDAQKQQLATIE
jgi:Spy/CpxP family protein refolding chaperone